MASDLFLRRKWTLRAHGRQVVFVKQKAESPEHVLMKALLWALYLPSFPDLQVEVRIGDRYKPDVVSLDRSDPFARPRFWGEAGQVSVQKLHSLLRRFPDTHFAIAKWNTRLAPHLTIVQQAWRGVVRHAPVDLIAFPEDSGARFVDARGEIDLKAEEIQRVRLRPDADGGIDLR